MSDETATQDPPPPPDEVEEDNVLRSLWPYSPTHFGIRVIETAAELATLEGLEEMARESLTEMIEGGYQVLMVEATVDAHGEMLAILTASLQASRRFGKGGAQA